MVKQREFHFAAEMGNHNMYVFLQVIQWAFTEKILSVEDVRSTVQISGLGSSSPFRDSVQLCKMGGEGCVVPQIPLNSPVFF